MAHSTDIKEMAFSGVQRNMIELIEWCDNVITEESVGRILKRLRLESNLTVLQLAYKSMLSTDTIHKAEHNRNVTLHTLSFLLDAMGYELTIRRKA